MSQDIKNLEQLVETYNVIYLDRFSHKNYHIDEAKKYIEKNLIQLKQKGYNTSNGKVINVGSGREVLAFLGLNFKKVLHLDINNKAVNALNQFKESNIKFKHNLSSINVDVCDRIPEISERYNLIFLSGVLHHMYDPFKGLENLVELCEDNAYLYLRLYRSGKNRWFLTELIRDEINFSMSKVLKKRMENMFVDFNDENIIKNGTSYLYDNLFDNWFVPNLHLFDIKKLNLELEKLGLKMISDDFVVTGEKDNVNLKDKSNNGISCIYKLIKSSHKKPATFSKVQETIISQKNQANPYEVKFIKEFKEIVRVKKSTKRNHELLDFFIIVSALLEANYLKDRFDNLNFKNKKYDNFFREISLIEDSNDLFICLTNFLKRI
ncbi:class I SAM-dependent methyltransferase [Alphaproteobacteria bacterium]|nr:class I SAM-dependent methyltransferase [Alphaproteobacteria bacterium]